MQARVYHLPLNVREAAVSLPVYPALLGYLDYWLVGPPADRRRHAPHRKNPGLNHVEDPDRLKLEVVHLP